jgi:hypothetical protein
MTGENYAQAPESTPGVGNLSSGRPGLPEGISEAIVELVQYQKKTSGLDPRLIGLLSCHLPCRALQVACVAKLPLTRDYKDTLVSRFEQECRAVKRMFADTARTCKGIPRDYRLSLVEKGTKCVDSLMKWLRASVEGTMDFKAWCEVRDSMESLYELDGIIKGMREDLKIDRFWHIGPLINRALNAPRGPETAELPQQLVRLIDQAMESESGVIVVDQSLLDRTADGRGTGRGRKTKEHDAVKKGRKPKYTDKMLALASKRYDDIMAQGRSSSQGAWAQVAADCGITSKKGQEAKAAEMAVLRWKKKQQKQNK